jgi:hypothetical protein
MALNRFPFRDPRTVARDIPGVLDILFPRLTGGLVGSLNRKMFEFDGIKAIPDELVDRSKLQKAMLFEISMARAESLLSDAGEVSWEDCLQLASMRQRRHYDAKVPDKLERCDVDIANQAAENLVAMLNSIVSESLSEIKLFFDRAFGSSCGLKPSAGMRGLSG